MSVIGFVGLSLIIQRKKLEKNLLSEEKYFFYFRVKVGETKKVNKKG